MSTPDEQAAAQIGQIATTVQGQAASEGEIAEAAQAQAGIGVTAADLDAIKAQLASFAQQLAASQASAAASPDALTGTVQTLVHHLEGHGDQAAIALGADAVEAAASAATGGGLGALLNIAKNIASHLRRNPPAPGENFHYNSALSTAEHLPVQIDRVAQAQETPAGQVLTGSVVG